MEGAANHLISQAKGDAPLRDFNANEFRVSFVLDAARCSLELFGNHGLAAQLFSTLPEVAQSSPRARGLELSIKRSAARDAARIIALADCIRSQWPDDVHAATFLRYALRIRDASTHALRELSAASTTSNI